MRGRDISLFVLYNMKIRVSIYNVGWCMRLSLVCVCVVQAIMERKIYIKCDRLSMSHASDLKIYRPNTHACGKSVTHTSTFKRRNLYQQILLLFLFFFFCMLSPYVFMWTLFVHCVYCITVPYTWAKQYIQKHTNTHKNSNVTVTL